MKSPYVLIAEWFDRARERDELQVRRITTVEEGARSAARSWAKALVARDHGDVQVRLEDHRGDVLAVWEDRGGKVSLRREAETRRVA